ncbi:MAG: glycosyltransferase family 2 protein [Desulfobacterales bacterium]|jgi:glycosyltransferase involved in cell wall biosynthesis
MDKPTVTVIIPAFNEENNINELVRAIRSVDSGYQVLVIDDGSEDRTAEEARSAGADVYSHPYNIGNGAAVKSGIRQADGDIFVFMDADGQHDPADIPRLLAHLPDYDLVVGARPWKDQASIGRAFGNAFYNRLASYVAKFPVKDLTSGFRAVKSHVAKSMIYLLPNTYSYPTTMTLAVLRTGLSLKYVPIRTKRRKSGKSNISLFKDGVRFFMIITRICTLFSPFRVFLPVSFFFFLLGLIRYAQTFITEGRFTNMSAMLFTTAVVIFMMGMISEQISQMRFERREGRREPRK